VKNNAPELVLSKKPVESVGHYEVGDIVFFSTSSHTVAGEGMFIGRL